jgi:hypothetical protein
MGDNQGALPLEVFVATNVITVTVGIENKSDGPIGYLRYRLAYRLG